MRSVDPYIVLKQHPTTTNVLKLVAAMAQDQLAINETEITELFESLEKDFEVQHPTVEEFDSALWQRLELIDISIDWIEVILTYNKNYPKKDKTEPKANNLSPVILSSVKEAIESSSQIRDSLIPRSFIEVEDSFRDNQFCEVLQKDREVLTSTLWNLYNFEPEKKQQKKQEAKQSLDWDFFYRLVSFTYTKILDKKLKKHELNSEENDTQNSKLEAEELREKCIAVSTLLFLAPVACSRKFGKYCDSLADFAEQQLGESLLIALFNFYSGGNLSRIQTDSVPSFESSWVLPNLIAIQSNVFGYFLNSKKYYQLLKAYSESAYETDYSEMPNGAGADFLSLISSLVGLIAPSYMGEAAISKFLSAFAPNSSIDLQIISSGIKNKHQLLNIDSVSLLLSEVIFDSSINEFGIEDYLSDRFISFLDKPERVPKSDAIWAGTDSSYFDGIIYRPVYFRNSRTLIAANCTFFGIERDPISLCIDGAESLRAEGFHKCSLTYLCYNLLSFIINRGFSSSKGLYPSTHKKLAEFLFNQNLERHINISYFQILSYCALHKDLFGVLFCGVLDSFLAGFQFENIAHLKLIKPQSIDVEPEAVAEAVAELGPWASTDANESYKLICKEIAHIKAQPAEGVWERKYKVIRGDVNVLLNEIDEVCTSIFKEFYLSCLEEIGRSSDDKWIEFRKKFDPSRTISIGTITSFFTEVQKIKSESDRSLEPLKGMFNDKNCFAMLKVISEENQLLIAFNQVRQLRNLFSHRTQRFKWTSVRAVLNFVYFDINDFLKIFKKP
jgi:hypothetical protein